MPAPLLFASEGQINAVVPADAPSEGQAFVRVIVDGVASEEIPVEMQRSAPNILEVLNADGSLNSPGQPAPAQSEVTVLVTGLGVAGVTPDRIARTNRELSTEGVSVSWSSGETTEAPAISSVRTVAGSPEGVVAVSFPVTPGESSLFIKIALGDSQPAYFSVYVAEP